MEIKPLNEFAADGLYCKFNVALCEGASVNGAVMPLAFKFCPLTEICAIVVGLFPVLVTVML
jgi:hypothetical protein